MFKQVSLSRAVNPKGENNMRREMVIGGTVLWTIACVVWSLFFGAPKSAGYYGESSHVYWAVQTWLYLAVVAVWYVLNWINMVNEWNRRPVLLFGKYKYTAGPGLVFIEPLIHTVLDDVMICDQVIEVGKDQQIQTKDNVGIVFDGILTYCIDENKVKDSVVKVEDVNDAVLERAISTLADEGAKADLKAFLEHRDTFCSSIKTTLSSRVSDWGVTIKAFELKNFKIGDEEIAKSIAMNAKAQKEGEAELTRANMQKQIAIALNEAAETLTEAGKWYKGVETLIELTRSAQNNTILIPTDLTGSLASFMLPKK